MSEDWIRRIQVDLEQFARDRDWEQYHTPRNLAALIASKAGEFLALFRWDQDATSESREEVELELADVFLGVLRFADVTRVNLKAACERKLEINRRNYPATKPGPDRERSN